MSMSFYEYSWSDLSWKSQLSSDHECPALHRDVVAGQNNVVVFLYGLEHNGERPVQYKPRGGTG